MIIFQASCFVLDKALEVTKQNNGISIKLNCKCGLEKAEENDIDKSRLLQNRKKIKSDNVNGLKL